MFSDKHKALPMKGKRFSMLERQSIMILVLYLLSVGRADALKSRCKEGQYYETEIDQCRSCAVPCKLSKDVCTLIGCKGYYQKAMALRENAQNAAMFGVQTANAKQSTTVPYLSSQEAPKVLELGLGGATVFLACTVLILTVGMVIFIRRNRKNGKKESNNNNDNGNQQLVIEMKPMIKNHVVQTVENVVSAVQEETPRLLIEESLTFDNTHSIEEL